MQQFLSVAHDVWDGKRKQINRLTLFFTHPETLQVFRIPVVLTPPKGKSAMLLCQTNMMGLNRVGAIFEDLYRSINYNTTPAVATCRL